MHEAVGLAAGVLARGREVDARVPGDATTEKLLHVTFADYRLRGEWFLLGTRMRSFLWRIAQRRQGRTLSRDDVASAAGESSRAYTAG